MKIAASLLLLAPLAGAVPQNPDVPKADPLEERAYLTLALRELMARWPAGLDAQHLAYHRDLIQRLAPRAQGELRERYADLLELNQRLEALLISQELLEAGAVASIEANANWFDSAALPTVYSPDVIAVMAEFAREAFEARGGKVDGDWKQLETDLVELWLRGDNLARKSGAAFDGWPEKLSGALNRFPNNPFVLVAAAEAMAEPKYEETASEALVSACWYSRAAQLTPVGEAYDGLRRQWHDYATSLAVSSMSRLWFEGDHRYLPDQGEEVYGRGVDALEVCLASLEFESRPEWRFRKAQALNMLDRPELAMEELKEVLDYLDSDVDALYDATCIASRAGQLDLAAAWIQIATTRGCDVAWARKDPELEAVRRERAEAFTEATELRWQWRLGTGEEAGRIYLENRSTFPLTEVTLTPQGVDAEGQAWSREFTHTRVEPGQAIYWELPSTLPSGEIKATLTASQV